MVSLAGYEEFRQIHDSESSQVYRARRIRDRQPVILKFLNRDYPTTEQIRRYKQEYHLTCQLESPGIVKAYSLEEWGHSYAIALEDFDGISLQHWLKQRKPLSLQEFLVLGMAITESLGQIHAQQIIHKDINPANIVFNPETQELKIIDFGIATQLSRENPTLKNPHVLEGTLAYISPEQTGRMNRGLDYRTDFYSLGVTFYELLTGKLPFETIDPLELVHCHIAQNPPIPLSQHPPFLFDIVMKLMAKNAEDRYQSAYGLKADLETCLNQLTETGTIAPFPLGQQDSSERWQIPQKLYGREAEISPLLAAFERVSETGNVELMLVAGYSGIGKSSLVQELYKPITARRGYFISGKFDQFQRTIPYSALVAAFRQLIEQLLGETEAQLHLWRDKLLQALGNNGQIIIDVIPEVELIIGRQPPVPPLGVNEAQNRFNLVFENFIRTFCSGEHPLAMFLDDLQWGDLATLKLMERILLDGETQFLLLLGAYRDNEVSVSHPLAISLQKLQQTKGDAITQVTLAPLSLNHVTRLIRDTLHTESETVGNLAHLVWQKTGGNPFFINEFLQALYSEKLLQFHPQQRRWQWDLAAIERTGFTDNVVELMVGKLQKLPPASQTILSIAACCGAEFNLRLLTWVEEKSAQDIFDGLKVALERGLIFPLSEADENLLIQSYKFGHDRIQQAAYSLISERQQQGINLKIGRLLLKKLSRQERTEKIFEIVDRLNGSRSLITDAAERLELVKLNLLAGKQAKDANAYGAARDYLIIGMEGLTNEAWSTDYDLTLKLYKERIFVEYLNGNFEASKDLIDSTLPQVHSALDKAEIYKLLMLQYTLMANYAEAIETGRKALALFGVDLPKTELKTALAVEIEQAKRNLRDRPISSLLEEPEIAIPEQKMVGELLENIDPPAYFFNQELYAVIVVKMANLFLTYGNIPEAAKGYVTYGIILGSVLGDYQAGYEFGCVAVKLSERFNSQLHKCGACLIFAGHLNHWVKPIKFARQIFEDCYHAGLSSGELRHSGYALEHQLRYLFYQGVSLKEILELLPNYLQFMEKTKNQWAIDGIVGFKLALLNLRGMTPNKFAFQNEALNDVNYLETCRTHNSFAWLCTFNIFKAQILYLYDESEMALAAILDAGHYLDFVLGHFQVSEYNFHYSLILASLYPQVTEESQQQYWQQLEANQQQLKIWSDHCPENFRHKYLLIAAEMARISGDPLAAMELYDQAIDSARKNKFIHNEALANELAAKFWLGKGKTEFAKIYLKNAHYGYKIWGAKRKVEELDATYPKLLRSLTVIPSISATFQGYTTSDATDSELLDLATTIKSTNAISSEIVLDKLLANLMTILVENAGAQRGILILPSSKGLLVEATKEADSQDIPVLQSVPLEQFERLSSKIVHYVARTCKTVVLNDATRDDNFANDFYIQTYHCLSIACTPLINQGRLQGIIYLENNLTTSAFTEQRMALLRTLATQAAISLENAKLYDNITTLNAAYERFIPAQFLSFLDKASIVDVKLGDQVEREMTVLFADIRDFTPLSEQMTPGENFAFINEYLSYMEPQIQNHSGFIDKYIGDAIMALFPHAADDGVKGGIAMLEALKHYNQLRQKKNLKTLRIGIGLHTGLLMLGTVGGLGRMDGTAIGDAVNLSSRIEGLTKRYGVSFLITHQTLGRLNNPLDYDFRFIEQVTAKGKTKAVGLFEVFSADPPELRNAKIATKATFEKAVMLYHFRSFAEAASLFQNCVDVQPSDRAAQSYLERCHIHIKTNPPGL